MYEIYTKEYLFIQKKKRFLIQELQLFVGKLRVANRKTMSTVSNSIYAKMPVSVSAILLSNTISPPTQNIGRTTRLR